MSHTIAAVSTGRQVSAIGIIRLSGDDCIAVADKVFSLNNGKRLSQASDRRLYLGTLHDKQGRCLDQCMAVVSRGPHTYTGEDTVEFHCHGSPAVLAAGLEALYLAGAKPAKRGEFTKRAFLNGKLDLTQAEAVIDLIEADTADAAANAAGQVGGVLQKKLAPIYDDLVNLCSHFHAVLDYPDEDIEDFGLENYSGQLKNDARQLEQLLQTYTQGRILKQGVSAAIVGKPNVGKSSLLNALLKEERAIVSQYAGTTRDVIEEQLLLDGVPLVLADTAGIRSTEDFVEKIGVEKSRQLLQDAELVICVVDGSEGLTAEDEAILAAASGKPCVIIVNKSDLGLSMDLEALRERFGKDKVMTLSAKTLSGVEDFSAWLKNYVYGSEGTLSDGVYVQNARQERLLREARQSLAEASEAAAAMLPYDCIEIDVRNAIDLLGEITGDTVQDEIINEIFSRFCIGK